MSTKETTAGRKRDGNEAETKGHMKIKTRTIGVGVLSWPRAERVSDRYGVVHLTPQLTGKAPKAGEVGTLVVEIVETRQSEHIGDLFHGIFPRKTAVGVRLTLGSGTVVRENHDGMKCIGVDPGKPDQWLDMRALYDCHEHVVKLLFVEGKGVAV